MFDLFLQRIGLEVDEAKEINELTSIAQTSQSWIKVQANLMANGCPRKLAKGEAAIALINGTIGGFSVLEKNDILMLLKGISAIFGFQYQKKLTSEIEETYKKPEIYEKVRDIIASHQDTLDLQYEKSLNLYNNRGFIEKILG